MLWEVEESPKSGAALEVLREWKQTQDTDIVSFAPLHFKLLAISWAVPVPFWHMLLHDALDNTRQVVVLHDNRVRPFQGLS